MDSNTFIDNKFLVLIFIFLIDLYQFYLMSDIICKIKYPLLTPEVRYCSKTKTDNFLWFINSGRITLEEKWIQLKKQNFMKFGLWIKHWVRYFVEPKGNQRPCHGRKNMTEYFIFKFSTNWKPQICLIPVIYRNETLNSTT